MSLWGTDQRALANEQGAFALEGLRHGLYGVIATGQRPGRKGADTVVALARVEEGRSTQVELNVDRGPRSRVGVEAPQAAIAQTVVAVTGIVRDYTAGQGIPEVSVRLGNHAPVLTGPRGWVYLGEVPPGVYPVEFRHLAFGVRSDTVRVEAPGPASFLFELDPSVIELDPVFVTVLPSRTEGYLRRGTRVDFLSRHDIDVRLEHGATDIVDILASSRLPGLRVRRAAFDDRETPWKDQRPGICIELSRSRSGAGTCRLPVVYVNDVLLADPEFYLLDIDPEAIELVEVRSSLEAGARYGTGSGAGVVLIYLRTR